MTTPVFKSAQGSDDTYETRSLAFEFARQEVKRELAFGYRVIDYFRKEKGTAGQDYRSS